MADVMLAFLCLFVAEVRLAYLYSSSRFSLMVACDGVAAVPVFQTQELRLVG